MCILQFPFSDLDNNIIHPEEDRVCEGREGREGGQESSVDEQEPPPERTGGEAEDGGPSEPSPVEEGGGKEEGAGHKEDEVDMEKERPLQRSGLI